MVSKMKERKSDSEVKNHQKGAKRKENQIQSEEESPSMGKGKKVKRKESQTQREEESPLMENKKEKGKENEKEKEKEKQYWLLKTEPGEWSWEDQAENGGVSKWDGVKNKQAQKNLKSMKLGDLCFFYHSGTKACRVVGVVEFTREWYSEGDDEAVVDVKAVGEMRKAVDLSELKGDERMKGFALLRQPRLSVVVVPGDVWERICELGGGYEGDGNEVDDNIHGED